MNLQHFNSRGTVIHEFGHVLGFAHEQFNPQIPLVWNRPAVYADFAAPPNNWSKGKIEHNVFNVVNRGTDPFFEVIGDYDPDSIMHYAIDMFSSAPVDLNGDGMFDSPPVPDTRHRLVSNWEEACPDARWADGTLNRHAAYCIARNHDLSDGDRAGMRVLYPYDEDLDQDVRTGSAPWVEYSPNLSFEANAVLYQVVPQNIRENAFNGHGNISIHVAWRGTTTSEFGCTTIFGRKFNCKTKATAENFRASLKYNGTEVGHRFFAVNGFKDLGRGFISNGYKLCGTVACLSAAVIR